MRRWSVSCLLLFRNTLTQFIKRRWRPVNSEDLCNIQFFRLKPPGKMYGRIIDGGRVAGGRPIEQVALENKLLVREIGDEHLLGVRAWADVEQLDGRNTIGQSAFTFLDALPFQRLGIE